MFEIIKDRIRRFEQRQESIESSLRNLTGLVNDNARAILELKNSIEQKSSGSIEQPQVGRDEREFRSQEEVLRVLSSAGEKLNAIEGQLIDIRTRALARTQDVPVQSQPTSLPPEAEAALRSYSEKVRLYEQDLYNKIKSPLIMELINTADRLSDILALCESERDKDAVRRERDAVVGVLHNNSVEQFISSGGAAFDAEFQTVVNTEETEDPALDNTVAHSLRPGYVWTLPFAGKSVKTSDDAPSRIRIIMREEQITLYILKKQ